MALAPYSFFFAFFAAGAVFLAAGTVASISSGVAAAVLVPPASHSISLPGTGDRTDSEGAFLHTYLRRLWNFSIRGASGRLRSRLTAFWRLSANWPEGDQPYVSRGPRPAMWYRPLRHDGATGPTIFSDVTTPSPTAAAILARSWA